MVGVVNLWYQGEIGEETSSLSPFDDNRFRYDDNRFRYNDYRFRYDGSSSRKCRWPEILRHISVRRCCGGRYGRRK